MVSRRQRNIHACKTVIGSITYRRLVVMIRRSTWLVCHDTCSTSIRLQSTVPCSRHLVSRYAPSFACKKKSEMTRVFSSVRRWQFFFIIVGECKRWYVGIVFLNCNGNAAPPYIVYVTKSCSVYAWHVLAGKKNTPTLCVNAVFAVARCSSVCPYVSFGVSTRLKIPSNFFSASSPIILVFLPPAPIPNSKTNLFSGGAKYTVGGEKLRFSTEIVYLGNGTR